MGEQTSGNAAVKIVVGQNEVEIEGSEDFISEELSTVLETLDLETQPDGVVSNGHQPQSGTVEETSNGASHSDAESDTTDSADSSSNLEYVASKLDVEVDSLKRYFFVDDGELHIENPLNIPPRFALLGWCTIENERKGKVTFENLSMKDKLVSQEGVEIDGWGDFVYNARRRGDIRDDPDSDQNRNKPFRLTRDGREAFIEWLEEDGE